MKKVLLVEDDPSINNNIKEMLLEEDLLVDVAFDGNIAEKFLKKSTYDCVILDINLPGKNGYDVCKSFRLYNNHTPVIMLTAFNELEDKVQGYDSGADDYLTKPFFMRELSLRVNSLLKRTKQTPGKNQESEILTADDIVIELNNAKVSRAGKEITLTPREYQILLTLIQRKGDLVSKKELINSIWGNIVNANTNTIEVYINFLRKKIDIPFNKHNIKTKIGFGYYFDEDGN